MKILSEIQAKLRILQHLQSQGKVKPEIIEAAKAKMGADLSDGLSRQVAGPLCEELSLERERLQNKQFRKGDVVSYPFDDKPQRLNVLHMADGGHSVRLDYNGGYSADKDECTSVELTNLSETIAACKTLTSTDR